MQKLASLEIVGQVNRRKHAFPRELVHLPLPGGENEVSSRHRRFLTIARLFGLNVRFVLDFLLIVGSEEGHQALEAVQIPQALGRFDLSFIVGDALDLKGISLGIVLEALEEFSDFLLLALEFPVLDVQVENSPDVFGLQFGGVISPGIPANPRNVSLGVPE